MTHVQRYLKDCEGCTMFHMGIDCKVLEMFKAQECPCRDCLIKVVCEEGCDKFHHITRDIDDDF
jgi:hypothetical protein